jgi:hypothetical protein
MSDLIEESHGSTDRESLDTAVRNMRIPDGELFHIIQGHDYCSALAFALRRAVGSCNELVASPSHVETMLRLSYAREHFERTEVYRSICSWEDRSSVDVLR